MNEKKPLTIHDLPADVEIVRVGLSDAEAGERNYAGNRSVPRVPTAAQLRALIEWAKNRPGYWKAALDRAWTYAGAGFRDYPPELQQVRNEFGPSWLKRQTLAKLEAALARLESR